MDGFQREVIQHECQIENRIAEVDDLEVQQERGWPPVGSRDDYVLWAVVAVYEAEATAQHRPGLSFDVAGQVGMRLGGGPMIGVNAQLDEATLIREIL